MKLRFISGYFQLLLQVSGTTGRGFNVNRFRSISGMDEHHLLFFFIDDTMIC